MNAALPQAAPDHRRIRRCRRRQDQARRSLCLNRLSPARRRSGRRRLCGHLPGYRHRHRQGVHRRSPALQRPYPGLACDRGHGRGQDRFLLRRSGQAGLRRLVDGKSRQLPQGHDRERAVLACAALGALPGVVRRRLLAADAKRDQRGVKPPGSLLVIILIVIVFIVVVGLTGGVMRPVALVVPELAIDAVGGEQLRMRAALDRLAA